VAVSTMGTLACVAGTGCIAANVVFAVASADDVVLPIQLEPRGGGRRVLVPLLELLATRG